MKKITIPLLLALLLIPGLTACSAFLVQMSSDTFTVEGVSMEPNYTHDETYPCAPLADNEDLGRGDAAVFQYPNDPARTFLKRVIGLPGETVTIASGQVYIDGLLLVEPYVANPLRERDCPGCTWVLGADEYFVMGDNRTSSKDSKDFGPVSRGYFTCRVLDYPDAFEFGGPVPTPAPTAEFTPSPTNDSPYGSFY